MGSVQLRTVLKISFTSLFLFGVLLKYVLQSKELVFGYASSYEPLSQIVYAGFSTPILTLLSLLLVVISALAVQHSFIKEFVGADLKSFYASLYTVVFFAVSLEYTSFFNVLAANLIVILAIGIQLKVMRSKHRSYSNFFDASFLIALASMVYVQALYAYLLLLLFIPYAKGRNGSRILLLYLLGFAVPYFLLFSLTYYMGQPFVFAESFSKAFEFGDSFSLGAGFYFVCVTGLLSLVSYLSIQFKAKLSSREKQLFSYLGNGLIIMLLVQVFFVKTEAFNIFLIAFSAVLLNYYFVRIQLANKFIWAVLLLSLLYLQYPSAIVFV